MQALIKHTGIVIPLNRSDIDTDAMLPKQYLKKLEKVGYGDFLFDDERYLDVGDVDTLISSRRLNPDFLLNQTPYDQGTIILAQKNFGCGSSREHAVWALRDFGIRVIIAPSYGDIFYNNCFNNGLLPIIVESSTIDDLFALCGAKPQGLTIDVDVANCTFSCAGFISTFTLPESRQCSLLKGLDPIGQSLHYSDQIRAFERIHRARQPWLFNDYGLR
jgi:3-isopropylmalate/(R)-2-methylmalate dehydratase small subunit